MRVRDENGERLEVRTHGIVLVRPLAKAVGLALVGGAALAAGGSLAVAGVVLLAAGALVALLAAWTWDGTRVVVTHDALVVVRGALRRRAETVRLARVGAVAVEQTVLGRLLGYGTLVAGELEVPYVTAPREVSRALARG